MEFENAKIGLRKVFNAQILSIIAAIVSIIAVVAMVVLGEATYGNSYNNADIISVLFIFVAAIISIIAFVLNFIGISKTSKDDESFKNALILLIIALVASILNSFLELSFIGFVHDIASLFVSYYVIGGCMKIAETKGDTGLAATCKTARTLIIAVWVINAILEFLFVFTDLLAIAGAICEIIAYIIYLVILNKTIKIL